MDHVSPLVVTTNQTKLHIAVKSMAVGCMMSAIAMLIGFYLEVDSTYAITTRLAVFIICKLVAPFMSVVCGMSLAWGIYSMNIGAIMFVFDGRGAWIRSMGFVPWSEISEVDMYSIYNTPMSVFSMRFKNPDKIAMQSNWEGKLRLFWSKIFGYPPIALTNFNIPDAEIVRFCKNRMLEPIQKFKQTK